jgi:drug/metabolite transporter (DMT)-like permease
MITKGKWKMKNQVSAVSAPLDRKLLLPFLGFILIAGGGPIAMRTSFLELDPFWVGFIRFGLGAVVFWLLALFKGLHIPRGRALMGSALFGLFGFGISFILLSWGLVKTPASLAAVLLALLPLLTIVLSVMQKIERFTINGVIGSLLAVAGTAVIVGGTGSMNISLPHIGAIILGVAFLAQSGVVIKRYPPNHPIMTNAVALTVGAVIMAGVSLLVGEHWTAPILFSTWVSLIFLVIFVTIISFILYLQVLAKWAASSTSYAFVITPLVTILISTLLFNESITLNFLMGSVFVISGVAVGALLHGKDRIVKTV